MEGQALVAPTMLVATGVHVSRRAGHEAAGHQLVCAALGPDPEASATDVGQDEGAVHLRPRRVSGARRAADVMDLEVVVDEERCGLEVGAHGRSPEPNVVCPAGLGESCGARAGSWDPGLRPLRART